MKVPNGYELPIGETSFDVSFDEKEGDQNNFWIVYSDRPNNLTYNGMTGKKEKVVQFLERFYVIETVDSFLHVVKHDPEARSGKRLNKTAIDCGWMKKERALLWNHALVNRQMVTKKVLTINNIESIKNPKKYVEGKKIKLYNDPELTIENENDVRLFQFLYLYKEVGNSYLIGKADRCNNSPASILGWISKDMVKLWSDRVTLEPNTDYNAIQNRISQNVKTAVFADKKSAIAYKNGEISWGKALWKDDLWSEGEMTKEKKEACWKRLPILENDSETNILKTGIISDIFDSGGDVVITSDEYEKELKKINTKRDEYRNINVVFVIDGTLSMQPYFSSVVNSLKRVNSLLEESKNNYRFGAVVYRDYAEEECPFGNRLVNIQTLTSSKGEIKKFLESMIPEAKDCLDKDVPEAMYYGINRGLRMMDPINTNIMIVVGDAGNRDDDERGITIDKITDKMAELNCHYINVQVKQSEHESYMKFILQNKQIIEMTSAKHKEKTLKNHEFDKPLLEMELDNKWTIGYPEKSSIMGMLLHPDYGNGIMKPIELENVLVNSFKKIEQYHQEQLEIMDVNLSGIGKRNKKMNMALFSLLNQADIDTSFIKKISNDNFQFFVEGYTPLFSAKVSEPLYQYTLYADKHEYSSLDNMLYDLTKVSTGSERRVNIENVFKETLKNYYGNKEVGEALNKMNVGEIMKMVSGLPTSSEMLKNYKVSDFRNKRIIPDQKMDEIFRYLEEKGKSFTQISHDPAYMFKSADVIYYWIPQRFIP